MPVVAVREWLTGMRPVVGALGASGLMLLACSWFAFNPSGSDAGRNADAPPAVRIDNAFNQALGESHALRTSARTTPAPRSGKRPAHARHAPVTAMAARTPAVEGRGPNVDASPGPATQSATAHGSTQPAAPSSSTTSPPEDSGGVTVTTPTLPPPLDGVPTVTTPALPVPQLPSVPLPDLPTTPPKLGLP